MDGERQIAEEVETQLRKTLDMYEQLGFANRIHLILWILVKFPRNSKFKI